jgi:alpha-L-fucosidase
MFNESDIVYTSRDIRFTVKGDVLYAIVLDWPGEEILIRSLVQIEEPEEGAERFPGYYLYPGEIRSITMLGDGRELEWELIPERGLRIETPETKPCEHAFTFKILRDIQ